MRNGKEPEPGPQGVFSYLFGELGRAVQDIRQRVVEEGWFGRITTPLQRDHTPASQAPAERPITFDDLWPRHEGPDREPGLEPDRSIDR
jgi:hypothetical protein